MKNLSVRALSGAVAIALLAGAAILWLSAPFAAASAGGPSVVLSSTASSTTNSSSIPVTATFSGDVSGFTAGDIVAASSTVSNFASSSGSVYTFTLTPASDGQVSVMVPADVASSTASTTLGNQTSNTLTFTSDATGPVISSTTVTGITSTGATVNWNTSEPATGQVVYGTTTGYGSSSTLNASLNSSHTAALTGLSPSTTYHYRVQSTDAAGNIASSSDATFTTSASLLAPSISGVSVSGIGTSSATVTWTTNLPASSQVLYGTTTGYGSSSTLNSTASTSHSVVLSGLSSGTVYHFAVRSANATGTTTSSDSTFVTQSTASSTPLAVTGVDTVSSTAVANNSFADGWKWTIHLTVPDTEDAFHIKFSDWAMSSTTSFPTGGNVRVSSPQSSNASTTATGIIETGNTYSGWLYLTGDNSTGTPGRQIDLVVEVKIPVGTPNGSYTTTYTAQSFPQNATSTAPTI